MKSRIFKDHGIYVEHLCPHQTYVVCYRNAAFLKFSPKDVLKSLRLSKSTRTRNELEEFLGVAPEKQSDKTEANTKMII